jgi:hypothetical protein
LKLAPEHESAVKEIAVELFHFAHEVDEVSKILMLKFAL